MGAVSDEAGEDENNVGAVSDEVGKDVVKSNQNECGDKDIINTVVVDSICATQKWPEEHQMYLM